MKVAELFVELGFKVQDEDKLKAFEQSLNNAANAATRLVAAMKLLARTKFPTIPTASRPAGTPAAAATGGAATPATPPVLATGGGALSPNAQGTSTAAMGNMLKNLWKGLGFLGLAVTIKQLISALKGMAINAMQSQLAIKQMTQQTGMARDDIKKWEYLGGLAGVSAEQMHQQILSLMDMANEMRLGGPGPQPSLAIPITQLTPGEILKQFEERTRGFGPEMMRMFTTAYGIDPRIILALREFPNAFAEAEKRLSATNDQLSKINELNTAFSNLRFTLENEVIKALADLAPYITRLVQFLDRFTQGFGRPTPNLPYGANYMIPPGVLRFASGLASGFGQSPVNNTNNVNVTGVDKPSEVARAVSMALEGMFSESYWQRSQWSGFGNSAVFSEQP